MITSNCTTLPLLCAYLLFLSLTVAQDKSVAGKFEPTGAKVASMTVEAASGSAAKLVLLSNGKDPYSLEADKKGTFSIRQGSTDVLTISEDGDLVAKTKMLAAGALSADKGFYVKDVMQWALAVDEQYYSGQHGWQKSDGGNVQVTQCRAGIYMLGGFGALAKSSIKKNYTGKSMLKVICLVGIADYCFLFTQLL